MYKKGETEIRGKFKRLKIVKHLPEEAKCVCNFKFASNGADLICE